MLSHFTGLKPEHVCERARGVSVVPQSWQHDQDVRLCKEEQGREGTGGRWLRSRFGLVERIEPCSSQAIAAVHFESGGGGALSGGRHVVLDGRGDTTQLEVPRQGAIATTLPMKNYLLLDLVLPLAAS